MSLSNNVAPSHDERSNGVKIEFPMKHFIPQQATIYSYFSIMKNHGYVSEVVVFKENQRYHIGVTSKILTKPNSPSILSP